MDKHNTQVTPDEPETGNEPDVEPSFTRPQVDTALIYPVVGAQNEVPSINTLDENSEEIVPKKIWVTNFIAKLAAGALVFALIGLVLGYIGNGSLVSHSGAYFGGLTDSINFLFYLIPLCFFFGIASLMSRNMTFLLMPLMAYSLAGNLAESDFISYVGNYIPLKNVTAKSWDTTSMAAVMAAYVLAWLMLYPIFFVMIKAKNKPKKQKEMMITTVVITLLIVITACTAANNAGSSLYNTQVRQRQAVSVPESKNLFANILTKNTQANINFTGMYDIYYPTTTQKDGVYQMHNEVTVRPVEKWWKRSVQEVCGVNKQYMKTQSGALYSETTMTEYGSVQSTPDQREWQKTTSCFVIGYQKYTLERSTIYGTAYIEAYPTSAVIDQIIESPALLPACYDTTLSYCRDIDRAQLKEVFANFSKYLVPN